MGANRPSRSSSRSSPRASAPGLRPASALVDRLCGSSAPVVTVVAPAGYGKTTVLRQWAEQDDRPFAWLSIDDDDNDPAVLVTYLAVALDRVQPIDARVFAALRGQRRHPVGRRSEAGSRAVRGVSLRARLRQRASAAPAGEPRHARVAVRPPSGGSTGRPGRAQRAGLSARAPAGARPARRARSRSARAR